MMECTDRHFRYLLRLISRRALVYTEMIPSGAVTHGERERFLRFDPLEHPIAVQFGGSNPYELAECARMAAQSGYDEINLNVGCPSARVQKGRIGACLMADPGLVAECVDAMCSASSVPVSVKTRIGIDRNDAFEFLAGFVETVVAGGCKKFVIHARKALLQGLSPKENRSAPPLRYDLVYRLKKEYPSLEIVLNGGIRSLDQSAELLERVDGVMIGREVYKNPYLFSDVDRRFYADSRAVRSRFDVLQDYLGYMQEQLDRGERLSRLTQPLFGLFHARPHSRDWRRRLSELTQKRPEESGAVIAALAASVSF